MICVLAEPIQSPGSSCLDRDEDARLYAWRLAYALSLGYSLAQANELAASRVDLHELERLLKLRCPPDVAVRILR